MLVHRWVWVFAVFAGVQGAQTLLHREVVPFAGTLATAALLGLAASRHDGTPGARRHAVAGLAVLTLAAGVVDFQEGGFGWPTGFEAESGLLAAVLVAAGLALLAVAVLERAAVPLRRLVPAAVLALVVVASVAGAAEGTQWHGVFLAGVLLVPAVALILLLFAANAALAAGARRWRAAGFGLLPAVVLALGAFGAFADLTPAEPGRTYYGDVYLQQLQVCETRNCAAPQLSAQAEVLARLEYLEVRPASAIAVKVPDEAPAAITWSWDDEPDWGAVTEAAAAAALLLGVAAFVRAMFRV